MRLITRNEFTVNGRQISDSSRPFIIAEAGVNYYEIAEKEHMGLMEAAKLMVSEAAKAGADAIKFQSYKAGKIASKDSPAYWDTKKESTQSQYALFEKYDKFGIEEYTELSVHAKKCGIIFMSTPFDMDSADYLADLMPAYKVASSDITNFPLLRHIANKNKPVFLSTGASTLEEIQNAINVIVDSGNNQIALLHCILNYPTEYVNANLNMIKGLRSSFPDYIIGYSDHTLPDDNMLVLTSAVILGASIIDYPPNLKVEGIG